MSRERRAAHHCCSGTREVCVGVESLLVSRGSSEGAACCNGLLQIDCEIRRHTIRPRRAAERGPLQANTTVFIVILTHRTTALDIGLESGGLKSLSFMCH